MHCALHCSISMRWFHGESIDSPRFYLIDKRECVKLKWVRFWKMWICSAKLCCVISRWQDYCFSADADVENSIKIIDSYLAKLIRCEWRKWLNGEILSSPTQSASNTKMGCWLMVLVLKVRYSTWNQIIILMGLLIQQWVWTVNTHRARIALNEIAFGSKL